MMSPYHTGGFYYAPALKGLMGSLFLGFLAAMFPLSGYRHWFYFSYETLFEKHQIWRMIICRCLFLDPKDLMCALILLYHFRLFERKYGTQKFISNLLATWVLSAGFEAIILYASHHLELENHVLPAGPFGMVFGLFVPYFYDVPRVAITHLLGIPVTGKSLTYIIGLQLASGSLETGMLSFCGIMAGIAYRHNMLWVQSLLFVPSFIGTVTHSTLGKLLHTAPPSGAQEPMGATLEIQREQHIERIEQQMAWAQVQRQNQVGFGLFGNQNLVRPRRAPEAPPGAAAIPEPQPDAAPPPPEDQFVLIRRCVAVFTIIKSPPTMSWRLAVLVLSIVVIIIIIFIFFLNNLTT